jgi:predicted dehydrogenase
MGTEGGAVLDPGNDANTKIFREESGALTDTQLMFLPKAGAHELEIRAFVKSIMEDSPIEVPGEQGVMVSRILDSIYASSEQGKEIVL